MNRAKFLLLAALVVVWTGVLTLGSSANGRSIGGLGNIASALSATHVSDDAMALAGVVVLVCSNSGACAR